MKSVCLFYYKKLKIITKNPLFCRNSSNFVLHTVITFFVVSCNYRDGNANVRFHQQDTLERIFSNLESDDIHVRRARMDCGSCSREIVETIEK